ATLAKLPSDTQVLVPAGLEEWFEKRGWRHVHPMVWWQSFRVGSLRLQFVPAHHWSRRRIMDKNDSLWGGWVMRFPGSGGIYFAGDTAYGTCFRQVRARHPNLDAAILPIGAYTPRWHEHGVHMDPFEALQAFHDVGAEVLVPMHWGTFPMSVEPVLEPRELLLEAWAEAHPPGRLADLPLGGTHTWPLAEAGRPTAWTRPWRAIGRTLRRLVQPVASVS
ncbi:MAG: MBL fold metallo-hydrolase, partial [Thermoplasmatota archaeon]